MDLSLSACPLLRLRSHLRLSQRKFALQIGVTAAYVCRVETLGSGMGKDSALRTADRFTAAMTEVGITLEDLLRGAPETASKNETEPPEGAAG